VYIGVSGCAGACVCVRACVTVCVQNYVCINVPRVFNIFIALCIPCFSVIQKMSIFNDLNTTVHNKLRQSIKP